VSAPLVLALLGAYLIGSIPFSFLVARRWGIADVRTVGSGNVGATNVMRAAGKLPGLVAFALDAAKGAVAVLVTRGLALGEAAEAVAAVVAVLGHVFPVWLSFRGGKGVATGLGCFLPLAPRAALAGLGIFVLVAAATRYVAVASISGGVAVAITAWWLGAPAATDGAAAAVAALLVFTHRSNLRRLASGTEARLGSSRPGP
jgi:glycerol-3-phosphate acyltransferase PlsY